MADTGKLHWGNIEVAFDAAVFAQDDIAAGMRSVDARIPDFSERVPDGTLIALSRHSFSGDYVGAYQVGAGRPHGISARAWTARRAAGKLIAAIASQITAELSPLRPRS